MPRRDVDPKTPARDEDWVGNNAAFTCPVCGNVFLVSGHLKIHDGIRGCPACDKSEGHVKGGSESGGEAYVEW